MAQIVEKPLLYLRLESVLPSRCSCSTSDKSSILSLFASTVNFVSSLFSLAARCSDNFFLRAAILSRASCSCRPRSFSRLNEEIDKKDKNKTFSEK